MKKKLLWFRNMCWIILTGGFVIVIFGLYMIPKSIYIYWIKRWFKNSTPWYIGDELNGISLVFRECTYCLNWGKLADKYNIKQRRPVKRVYRDKHRLFIYFDTDNTNEVYRVTIPLTSSLINTY